MYFLNYTDAVESQVVSSIERGLCVLVGVGTGIAEEG